MDVNLPILQLAGYQNSGKTTAAQILIKRAVKEGFQLGSIKHHGHGGEPDGTRLTKDSHKHLQAGAAVSAVEGNGMLQLSNQKGHWTLDQLIVIYQGLEVDGILVEGYKMAHYSKIVMIGKQEDTLLLSELTNIVAVIRDKTVKIDETSFPVFTREEEEKYSRWFIDFLRG
ncbi:molybdopterin-guanine dinucleotide biosynthesis protein B [Jeotgalibacillus campisalis]|uniref:Molybdopterin-guanine dinucleotide biosynthesis protein B (MobB) domain-containing protein n=1 Tax=Jeotgalibacillus campisalis TaxID=220754 RepID=A0A0C2RG15_9BACL|nr:molybdopterin-guanine dinucleotide biosynthesis protein B [Jeotgalibacillus campisalis]KIL49120.1 hypothetical protein KR50_11550 [Jeotgalibacillus campisalis]